MHSSALIKAYQRSCLLRKVMLVAFGLLLAATLLWVVPWVPWGLRTEDYSAGAGVAVALACGSWVAAFGAVYLRDQSNRYEQTLVTWSSLRDGFGDLRRREYFFERVVIECTRSEPLRHSLRRLSQCDSARAGASPAPKPPRRSKPWVVSSVRPIASLRWDRRKSASSGAGMGNREAPAFAYRLKSTLERAMTTVDGDQVSVGWAIWGVDGKDAGSLVGLRAAACSTRPLSESWPTKSTPRLRTRRMRIATLT